MKSSSRTTEVLLTDDSVDHLQVLLDGLRSDVQLMLVGPHQDAIEMLALALCTPGLETLHILGHGMPGAIVLGGQTIDAQTVSVKLKGLMNKSDEKSPYDFIDNNLYYSHTISNDLRTQICLWSCNTGAGEIGMLFMDSLANIANASVFATENTVGHTDLGGTWDLEKLSKPKVRVPFNPKALDQFEGLLALEPSSSSQSASNLDLSAIKVIPDKLLVNGFVRLSEDFIDRDFNVFKKVAKYGTVEINTNSNFASFLVLSAAECLPALQPHEIYSEGFQISVDHAKNDLYIQITVMGTISENVVLSMWLSNGLVSSPQLFSIISDQDISHVDFNCTLGNLYDTHSEHQ